MLTNVFPFPSYYFFNEKECRPGRNGHWQGLGNRLPLILVNGSRIPGRSSLEIFGTPSAASFYCRPVVTYLAISDCHKSGSVLSNEMV